MEQFLIGLFYGANGYDLLLLVVVVVFAGLVFSLINERGLGK